MPYICHGRDDVMTVCKAVGLSCVLKTGAKIMHICINIIHLMYTFYAI